MDIVIVSHFGNSYSESDNDRFLYLAKMLSENHTVEIITSDFFHGMKKHRVIPDYDWSFKITFLHELGYNKNVCLKRFLSHWIWGKNVAKYLSKRKVPDVIYCAVPSLTGPYYVAKYCKNKGVRFMVDVQDLWPEAFKMVFSIPIISDLIYAPMKLNADYIYKQADEIIAVSNTYGKRALEVNDKCTDNHTVFLGTELSTFDDNVKNNGVELDGRYFNLAYCGTLGHSYDIPCVIDAMDILKREKGIENIKFVVMGDGPLRHEFQEYAVQKQVNAEFTGRLDYKEMCGLLAACDVVVNPIMRGSAGSIINKHADYAASGLPVLNTQESLEYRELVESYHMGLNCENHDADDLAEKIHILIENSELREEMGKNARRCARELFDREHTYNEILSLIYNQKNLTELM